MTAVQTIRPAAVDASPRRATWEDFPLLLRLAVQHALRGHAGVPRPLLLGVASVTALGLVTNAFGAPGIGLPALWAGIASSAAIVVVFLLIVCDVARRLGSRELDIVLSSRRDASVDVRRPAVGLLVFSRHVAPARSESALREALSAAFAATDVPERMIVPNVEFAATVMAEYPHLVLHDVGGVLELAAPDASGAPVAGDGRGSPGEDVRVRR